MQQTSHSDLVIVGAGPHGLSMALRWMQGSVGNFSDHEHTVQTYLNNKEKVKEDTKKRESITVIDPAGEWMAKWNSMFDSFEINFLRSTMFMHPDTFDLYSFLAFAHANGRQSELIPITELYCEHQIPISEQKRKKKERMQFKGFSPFPENRRELFFRPSQKLFKDYCTDLIRKYQLADVVVRGSVVSTDVLPNGRICVTLDTCQKIEAKNVVFATGFSQPLVPTWFHELKAQAPDRVMHSGEWSKKRQEMKKRIQNKEKEKESGGEQSSGERQSNNKKTKESSMKAEKETEGYKSVKNEEIKGKRILVVGGGLTSAHLVLSAVNQGCEKVVLVSRKYLVTKLFDLDLVWMGACRNLQYSKFWNLQDFEDRIKMIKEARGGGSITFETRRQLTNFEQQGLLEIRENCEIDKVEPDTDSIKVSFKNCGNFEHFDYMWVATGSKIDILAEPYLQSYLQSNSVSTKCGFPVLDQNLKLNPKHNIFVMGGYASLQIGPDARNLSGCRNAADRICSFIENSKVSENSKPENSKSENAKNRKVAGKKSAQSKKDGKWINFGNEDFNAFSILAEDCEQ